MTSPAPASLPSNTIGRVPKIQIRGRLLKRTIDVIGSLALITIVGPLMVVIAIVLYVTQGRPLIYLRRVVGPSGEFDAWKFRSMRKDADEVLERNPAMKAEFVKSFKLKSDPRVTPVGAVIRKFSLDELPQLFNVVRGQMSLVGPRMITPPELMNYGDYQHLLLQVKPGLTGYWQVQGRQEVSYAERVKMDVEYILGWHLIWDLKILLLTPLRVVRGRGAY